METRRESENEMETGGRERKEIGTGREGENRHHNLTTSITPFVELLLDN